MQIHRNRFVRWLCALCVLLALVACSNKAEREPDGSADLPSTAPAPTAEVTPPPPSVSAAPPGNNGREPGQFVWNYWVDKNGTAIVPEPVLGRLAMNASQWCRFRLSMLNLQRLYPRIGAAPVASDLRATVQAALADPSASELSLDVLIHSADDNQLWIDPAAQHQVLKIDLARLRAAPQIPNSLPAIGSEQLRQMLDDAMLTQFGFKFKLLKPGIQQASVSVIDSASGFPLQTMVLGLRGDADLPGAMMLSSGGQTGLAGGGASFDLALYLYELKSTVNGVPVVSVQAELRSRAQPGGPVEFIHWKTDSTLDGLKKTAQTFRDNAGAEADGADLLSKGYDFGRMIFDPAPEPSVTAPTAPNRNVANAKRARQAIVAAANYPSTTLPPSMLVKIAGGAESNARFTSPLLPIGALGVSIGGADDAIYLGERFALALILSGQPLARNYPCPSHWYVAFPAATQETSGALYDMRTKLEAEMDDWPNQSEVVRQSATLAELKRWLESSIEPESRQPYVLAFLGHQGNGHLFLGNTGGVGVINMRRYFHESSIAILNACDSAMDDISDGRPVGKLAKRNVGATIATTSSISGSLAAAYMNCLGEVLIRPAGLTIGQAHALTTQCLWSAESGARWGQSYRFSGVALKYILVGNPFQSICAPHPVTEGK